LTDLEVLDCKHNEISYLLPEIGNLMKLKTFDLSFNMVTHLPFELGNLQDCLKSLDVSRNPLLVPPKAIIDKGTIALLDWLYKNKNANLKAEGLAVKAQAQ